MNRDKDEFDRNGKKWAISDYAKYLGVDTVSAGDILAFPEIMGLALAFSQKRKLTNEKEAQENAEDLNIIIKKVAEAKATYLNALAVMQGKGLIDLVNGELEFIKP